MKKRNFELSLLLIVIFTLKLTNSNAQNPTIIPPYGTGTASTTLGSANPAWSHILTDAPKFYFGKPIAIDNGQIGSYNTSNLSFSTGVGSPGFGMTRMTILRSNGNVGIGTTSPSQKLEVNGNIKATGGIYIDNLLSLSDNTGNFSIKNQNVGSWLFDFDHKLVFRNKSQSWVNPLLLQGDGTVVINAQDNLDPNNYYDTQGFSLVVNGGILAEEIKVIQDVPQSDYVFEKEYKLMSLQDVENYVNEHKHLPEIPSAAEFKANGYKVGEMDDVLLRKVEELTLYVIQLHKEIETLNSKK